MAGAMLAAASQTLGNLTWKLPSRLPEASGLQSSASGNCASSLIQGLSYYGKSTGNAPDAGLMSADIGGYRPSDIKLSAAFDVNASKIGRDVADAIFAAPNNADRFAEVPPTGVTVQRGPTFDGLGEYLRDSITESDAAPVDVPSVLQESATDIVVSYLPVGSQKAAEYYAESALSAGCAFVNCVPVFIASNADWRRRFEERGLPIIGDDIKSQVGATIVHRTLANLFRERGVRLDRTYQLNFGGNADFKNMLERSRLESKKISKTRSVNSQLDIPLANDDIHIGPSDHVPWLSDKKIAYIRMEGTAFGGAPLALELKLEVWDSAEFRRRGHRCSALREAGARSRHRRGAHRAVELFHEVAAAAILRSRGARTHPEVHRRHQLSGVRPVTMAFLVRHATPSLGTAMLAGRTPGVTLTSKGHAQAERLAERLEREGITAVHSSPQQRTLETARPIAERCGVAVEVVEALDEVNFGSWSGKPFDELERDPAWAAWNSERDHADDASRRKHGGCRQPHHRPYRAQPRRQCRRAHRAGQPCRADPHRRSALSRSAVQRLRQDRHRSRLDQPAYFCRRPRPDRLSQRKGGCMKIVIFGLTISSSWGNGHATLWRGLTRALTRQGHRVVFFERDVPYYAGARDLYDIPGGDLLLYPDWSGIQTRALMEVADSDIAIVTSYCPDGIVAGDLVFSAARGLTVFYDLDTPVTLSRLMRGESLPYIGPGGLAGFDLVLSYTGGQALSELQSRLGARQVAPLYGHVDPDVHRPAPMAPQYAADLSYLGTYAEDRQAALEALFVEAARQRPQRRFVIGGAQYPQDFPWADNIFFVRHLPPAEHPAFFSSSPFTLNVTRRDMAEMGWCPSGRLFEAAACGTALISDDWEGLDHFYTPGSEILIAGGTADTLAALDLSDAEVKRIAKAARERTLAQHSSEQRASELIALCEAARGDTFGATVKMAET